MADPTLTLINAGGGTLADGLVGTNADAENVTGWSDFDTLDTDIKVQGSNGITGTGRANNEDMYYDDGGAAITAAGKVFRAWFNTVNTPYMGTLAGTNPYELLISDGTNTVREALLGSDTYEGGWVYVFQDMDLATTGNGWTGTNPTLANVDRWGWTTGHDSNAKNVDNCWADAFRYMDGYYLTGGTSGDKVTLTSLSSYEMSGTRAYGIVQQSRGIFFGTGTIQIGNGATTTWFEMDSEILQFIDTIGDLSITAGLYEISATGSGCDCIIKNSVIRGAAAGSTTRIYFDFSDTNHTLTFTDNLIVDTGTIVFASGQTATGNTFDDCGQITGAGAGLDNSVVKNYEGTADTAALVWDVGTDTNGKLDGSSFAKGTAATHAVEFEVSGSYAWKDINVSGYNASDEQNDSVVYNSITPTLIDSYLESNQDDVLELDDSQIAAGQEFTATAGDLSSARFYLKKTGTPTGGAVAELYASDGGSPAEPTGAVLATSEPFDVSTLTGSYALVQLNFGDDYTMTATDYFIVLRYENGTSSNYVEVGSDSSSPGHSGDAAYDTGAAWVGTTAYDFCFYVYRDGHVVINISGGSGAISSKTVNAGAHVTTFNTVSLTVNVEDEAGDPIQDAQVAIHLDSAARTILMNEDSDATGEAVEQYDYPGTEQDIVLKVRKSETTDNPRYFPFSTTGVVTANGFSQTVTLKENTYI